MEWIGDELVIGYRINKNERAAVSDIEQVEHFNPTKHEQILKFEMIISRNFSIALDEYEARKAVKKLREDQIEVVDKFI